VLKVCFDLSCAVQQSAGISRYEKQLAQALVRLNGPQPYGFFYTSPQALSEVKLTTELTTLPHRSKTVSNKRWRFSLLLKHLIGLTYDHQVFPTQLLNTQAIFHAMDCIAPPLKAASIVTIHDLSTILYPQFHSLYNKVYLSLAIPICAKKARRIIAVSENTRRDLINYLGTDFAERIKVTPLGVSDESYFADSSPRQLQQTLSSYGLVNQAYLLNVGTIEPRKNQARLVESYAKLLRNCNNLEVPALVLVGRPGWGGEYERVLSIVQKYGLSLRHEQMQGSAPGQVLWLNRVNDETLKILYQAARIVLYPSLYEGFGLPALEALAAGSSLITSNNSSLPEITGPDGTTALLINPYDTDALAQAIQKLLNNLGLAQQLGAEGRKRARRFTWQHTAELTYQIYQEVENSLP